MSLEIKEINLAGNRCEIASVNTLNLTKDSLIKGYKPFNEMYSALKKEGFEIISAKEAAILSMHNRGMFPKFSECYLREGIVFVKDKGIYLTRKSPVLDHPTGATNSHARGRRYSISDIQLRKSLEDSVNIISEYPAHANVSAFYHPGTEKFNEDLGAKFLFVDLTKEFGNFLKSKNEYLNFLIGDNSYKKPSANQLRFNPRHFSISGYYPQSEKDNRRLNNCSAQLIGIRY